MSEGYEVPLSYRGDLFARHLTPNEAVDGCLLEAALALDDDIVGGHRQDGNVAVGGI